MMIDNFNYFVHECFPFLMQVMQLSPHVPIERCRLVKYDECTDTIYESFDTKVVSQIKRNKRYKEGAIYA